MRARGVTIEPVYVKKVIRIELSSGVWVAIEESAATQRRSVNDEIGVLLEAHYGSRDRPRREVARPREAVPARPESEPDRDDVHTELVALERDGFVERNYLGELAGVHRHASGSYRAHIPKTRTLDGVRPIWLSLRPTAEAAALDRARYLRSVAREREEQDLAQERAVGTILRMELRQHPAYQEWCLAGINQDKHPPLFEPGIPYDLDATGEVRRRTDGVVVVPASTSPDAEPRRGGGRPLRHVGGNGSEGRLGDGRRQDRALR